MTGGRTLSVRDLEVGGRRVFVRVDFNVPLAHGGVADDTRVRASLPTLRLILDRGGRPVIASHLGRPKGTPDPEMSLRPVATHLAGLLGTTVRLAPDCVGPQAEGLAGIWGTASRCSWRTCASMRRRKRTTTRSRAGSPSSPTCT